MVLCCIPKEKKRARVGDGAVHVHTPPKNAMNASRTMHMAYDGHAVEASYSVSYVDSVGETHAWNVQYETNMWLSGSGNFFLGENDTEDDAWEQGLRIVEHSIVDAIESNS